MTTLQPNRGGRATCCEVRDQLGDYLDADLGALLMGRLRRHVASCPQCRPFVDHELSRLAGTRQAVRAAAVPHWLEARVSAAMAAARTD
jgi:predicted anti-sigma-YlaC factor YlaD